MQVQDRIGPYLIEATLGRGGMGIVYKGFHEGLKRWAAIKTLDSAQSNDPEVRRRLHVEAEAQARLQHPNIVTIYDLIEAQGAVFLAMEYVEGTTLDLLLRERRERGLPPSEALGLFEQVLAALSYAHKHGVVHRDVKPANVMVNGEQVKLMDFGIALLTGVHRQTSSSVVLGTPAYMSPEQLRSSEVDHRTDIYSAAAVFYEMLAGQRLFEGKRDMALIHCHLFETPPDLRTLVPDLPAGVSEAVAIALRKDPQERFQTMGDLLRALQEGVAGFLPVAPETSASGLEETATASSQGAPPALTGVLPSRTGLYRGLVAASWALLAIGLIGSYGMWKAWYRLPSVIQAPRKEGPPILVASTPDPKPKPEQEREPPQVSASPETVVPLAEEDAVAEASPKEDRVAVAPPDPVPDPAEILRQEIERLREELRQGIHSAEAKLQAQSFDGVQEQLDQLSGRAQLHPMELQEEIEEIRGLRKRLADALSAMQAQEREKELKQADWGRRLHQIQNLMEQNKYPEADNLALDLIQEPGVPETVAARARELSKQAKEELKKIWSETQLGSTTNKLRKPKPPSF